MSRNLFMRHGLCMNSGKSWSSNIAVKSMSAFFLTKQDKPPIHLTWPDESDGS